MIPLFPLAIKCVRTRHVTSAFSWTYSLSLWSYFLQSLNPVSSLFSSAKNTRSWLYSTTHAISPHILLTQNMITATRIFLTFVASLRLGRLQLILRSTTRAVPKLLNFVSSLFIPKSMLIGLKLKLNFSPLCLQNSSIGNNICHYLDGLIDFHSNRATHSSDIVSQQHDLRFVLVSFWQCRSYLSLSSCSCSVTSNSVNSS